VVDGYNWDKEQMNGSFTMCTTPEAILGKRGFEDFKRDDAG